MSKTLELMKRIIGDGKQVAVTEETRDELKHHTGADISVAVEVRPNFPADKPDNAEEMVLACMPVESDSELILPDNLTAPCAWGCGTTIQYRPQHPAWLTKVCLQCLADRPLKDHA